MNLSDTTLKDQASGLRRLFHTPALPTHLLTCPSRPALALPLAQKMAETLCASGHVVAWLEEIELNARENWPLPRPVRFDVGQALEGHVDLSEAMLAIHAGLFYGLSCKTRKTGDVKRPLQERLMKSGVAFDALWIAAHPDAEPRRYAPSVRLTVISDSDQDSLEQTLRWMLNHQQQHGKPQSWGLILAGSEADRAQARSWLDVVAPPHLAQTVGIWGLMKPDAMHAPLEQAWMDADELITAMQQHVMGA